MFLCLLAFVGGQQLSLHIGSQMPRAANDPPAEGITLFIVCGEGAFDTRLRRQHFRQYASISRSLGDTGADVGTGDEGGIAEDGDAATGHDRRFEIDDRLQERPSRFADGLSKCRSEKPPGGVAHLRNDVGVKFVGRDRADILMIIGTPQQAWQLSVRIGGAIPDVVVTARPSIEGPSTG